MWVAWFLSSLTLMSTWALSIASWFHFWVALEICLLLCIPSILTHSSALSSEGLMKYFLIQAISSLIFLLCLLLQQKGDVFIVIALCLKLGLVPLFVWVPSIMVSMSYSGLFILTTLMKLPGLVLMSHLASSVLVFNVALLSGVCGSVLGVAMSNIKKLLSYSSVAHTGWICLMQSLKGPWCTYWVLYLFISASVLGWLSSLSAVSLTQLFNTSTMKSACLSVLILSLAGFPPLLGFYLKILLLSTAGFFSVLTLSLLLSLGAALYFYLLLVMTSWLSWSKGGKKAGLPLPLLVALLMNALSLLLV